MLNVAGCLRFGNRPTCLRCNSRRSGRIRLISLKTRAATASPNAVERSFPVRRADPLPAGVVRCFLKPDQSRLCIELVRLLVPTAVLILRPLASAITQNGSEVGASYLAHNAEASNSLRGRRPSCNRGRPPLQFDDPSPHVFLRNKEFFDAYQSKMRALSLCTFAAYESG